MSPSFKRLLWKEWLQAKWVATSLPIAAAWVFYKPDSSWYVLDGMAGMMAFEQIFAERSQAMWGFVVHRRASAMQILLAKLVVGLPSLLGSLAIGGSAIWFLSLPGHGITPVGHAPWLATIADASCALSFYAAGLYVFGPGRRIYPRVLVAAVPLAGVMVASLSPILAIGLNLVASGALTVAAGANFILGEDLEAKQPRTHVPPVVRRAAE